MHHGALVPGMCLCREGRWSRQLHLMNWCPISALCSPGFPHAHKPCTEAPLHSIAAPRDLAVDVTAIPEHSPGAASSSLWINNTFNSTRTCQLFSCHCSQQSEQACWRIVCACSMSPRQPHDPMILVCKKCSLPLAAWLDATANQHQRTLSYHHHWHTTTFPSLCLKLKSWWKCMHVWYCTYVRCFCTLSHTHTYVQPTFWIVRRPGCSDLWWHPHLHTPQWCQLPVSNQRSIISYLMEYHCQT